MALEIPDSALEIENRSKADVQRQLIESNPFLKNSWLGAFVSSNSNRVFDFYLELDKAIIQNFPDTSTDDFLRRWAAISGVEQLAATRSSGDVVATGVAGSTIESGSVYTIDTRTFEVISSATVADFSITVTALTRSGQTASATTVSAHRLANNVSVTISGADQSEYNVTNAPIVVTGVDSFEYQVAGSPTTPATGTILASHTSTPVSVQSQDFGLDQNLASGTVVLLQSPVIGVDNAATAGAGGVEGGTDTESDVEFRDRYLDKFQNPVANFNVAAIKEAAKKVAGVTRVFVEEITPEVGQVTVYFMRDNDPNPIPSASEIADVRTEIELILPANTDSSADLFVLAPIPISTNYVFDSLTPDAPTMRTAIIANLEAFFDEKPEVGVEVDEDAYRAAIFNTIDLDTGSSVSSFTLSSPSGDLIISTGEIATLGAVTFNI